MLLSSASHLATLSLSREEVGEPHVFPPPANGQDQGPIAGISLSARRAAIVYQNKNKGCIVELRDYDGTASFRALYADLDQVQTLQMLEDEEHLALSELKKGKYSKKIHIVRLVTKVKKSKRSDRID